MRPIVASDLMNPDVVTVEEDRSLKALARFLIEHEISGAPVVDKDNLLVGVVSLVDVARATTALEDAPSAGFLRHEAQQVGALNVDDWAEYEALTVGDIMTPEAWSVPEDATVSDVASVMMHHHLHRVIVVRDDEVVGIVSTSDLLGLLIDAD